MDEGIDNVLYTGEWKEGRKPTAIKKTIRITLSVSTPEGRARLLASGSGGNKVPDLDVRENFLLDPLTKKRNLVYWHNRYVFGGNYSNESKTRGPRILVICLTTVSNT